MGLYYKQWMKKTWVKLELGCPEQSRSFRFFYGVIYIAEEASPCDLCMDIFYAEKGGRKSDIGAGKRPLNARTSVVEVYA